MRYLRESVINIPLTLWIKSRKGVNSASVSLISGCGSFDFAGAGVVVVVVARGVVLAEEAVDVVVVERAVVDAALVLVVVLGRVLAVEALVVGRAVLAVEVGVLDVEAVLAGRAAGAVVVVVVVVVVPAAVCVVFVVLTTVAVTVLAGACTSCSSAVASLASTTGSTFFFLGMFLGKGMPFLGAAAGFRLKGSFGVRKSAIKKLLFYLVIYYESKVYENIVSIIFCAISSTPNTWSTTFASTTALGIP